MPRTKKDELLTPRDGVSVSICSKEALNRLLDGNEDLRIEIRDDVLKRFVNTNLKPSFDQDTRKYFGEALLKEMRKEIRAFFRDENTKSLVREMIIIEYEKVTKEMLGGMVEDRLRDLIQTKLSKIKL